MKKIIPFFTLLAVFFVAHANAQYCMLPGRTPYSSLQPGITNFKLNTINRSSQPVESMSSVVVVTTDSTFLLRGHKYKVTITHSRDSLSFPTARNNIRVWIDYNNNKSFEDAGETVISKDFQSYGVFTDSFIVPATAALGTVRLRATVKMSSDAGHTLPSSCDSPSADPLGYHGEIEDYLVKIAPTTGIDETNAISNIAAIYPNPTANDVTVSFYNRINEALAIDLFDITGRMIGNLLNEQSQSSLEYTFDLNKYISSPGVYLVRVSNRSGTTYQRVVKSN